MHIKLYGLGLAAGLMLVAAPLGATAAVPIPAGMPPAVRELSAHHPQAVYYYVLDWVAQGRMTAREGMATWQYMQFRFERRQRDLAAVEGMSRDERRAYMKARREERGNPMTEFARMSGLSPERSRVLMNLFHGNGKGDKYAEP